jgi:hypothetical protein
VRLSAVVLAALSWACLLVAGGCGGSAVVAPNQPTLLLPPGAQLVSYGRPDALLLPMRTNGSFYFVDERSALVVWVYTQSPLNESAASLPPTTQSVMVRAVVPPEMIGKSLAADHYYRVYFVPVSTGAY